MHVNHDNRLDKYIQKLCRFQPSNVRPARSSVTKGIHLHWFRGSRSGLQEPKTLDLSPDALLADKDEQHEKASQHIAAVNNSEEEPKEFDTMTWGFINIMDDKMESFYGPKNAKG